MHFSPIHTHVYRSTIILTKHPWWAFYYLARRLVCLGETPG